MGVTYKRLVADDWARMRDARLEALAEAPYAFASTLDCERRLTEEVWRDRAGGGRSFGAWHEGGIVGMAAVLPQEGGREWHLVGMWVAPAWRGRDVAGRLVAEGCALASEGGARTMTLWVTEVNHRARAFYRKLGFEPTGARQLVRPEEPDRWEEQLALRLDQASEAARTGTS